jgi:hypothetical protein
VELKPGFGLSGSVDFDTHILGPTNKLDLSPCLETADALLNRFHEPTVIKQRTTTPCITKVTWDSVSPCYTVVASNTTVVVVALVCT